MGRAKTVVRATVRDEPMGGVDDLLADRYATLDIEYLAFFSL